MTSERNLQFVLNALIGIRNDIEAECSTGQLTFIETTLYSHVIEAAREVISLRLAHTQGIDGLRFPDLDAELDEA